MLISSAFAVDTSDAQRPPKGFPSGRNKPNAPSGKAGYWYNLGSIGGWECHLSGEDGDKKDSKEKTDKELKKKIDWDKILKD